MEVKHECISDLPFLVVIQSRSNELPHLEDKIWKCQHYSAEERHLHMNHELRRHFYVDKRQRKISSYPSVKEKILLGRSQDHTIKEEILESK